MFSQPKLILAFALLVLAAPASASSMAYILLGNLDGSGAFGVIDLASGSFTQISTNLEGSQGLASGANGSLFTLAFTGTLNSIDPATGVSTVIGPTGLADCSTPASPCGGNSANLLTTLAGQIYVTDFDNNLYSVNATTGAASFVGPTGIPALPFVPLTTNPDNTFNAYDESFFGANGALYATFNAFTVSLDTFTLETLLIPPALYRIDPATGATTLIGPTTLNLGAVAAIGGSYYAFKNVTGEILALNLATGQTAPVTGFDGGIGFIVGAAETPEPAPLALTALGLAGLVLCARRRAKNSALALLLTLGAAVHARADEPVFTSIDYPGAVTTLAWGINARGDIGGSYVRADKTSHGFLLSGGQYRTIDFPGATSTDVFAISPGGDAVGVYTLAGVSHGYLLKGGEFTTVDYPGATASEVGAINSRGELLGDYTLNGVRHGFLLSGGQFTTIDFPGAANTTPVGFNPQGDIAGNYNAAGVFHGFRLADGDFTSIDFPNATRTAVNGINARGDIAGRYVDGGVSHAYLLSGGLFTSIDYPGSTFTSADSINQRGDIVGRYTIDGVNHGYLLTGLRPGCAVPMASPKISSASGGPAIAHSSDFSLVSAAKPAAPGEVLSLFATGLGPTRPGVSPGQQFPASPLAAVDSLVEVAVNGRSAIVLISVGLPGTINGYQVNFRLPTDTAKGTAAVQLSAAGIAGPPVEILVQ